MFEGRRLGVSDVKARGLACIDGSGDSQCYASARAAEDGAAAKASRVGRRPRAKASVTCAGGYALLWQFYYASFGGAAASLERRQAWYDNGSNLNNETSSYHMGEHSGHMSDPPGGGSPWLPYDTGVCAQNPNLNGTGWSDRVSSRYRN
jgi:hypothetical protein